MYVPPDHWPGQPRSHARLEVHLDEETQRKLTRFVTAFGRSRSAVLRHVLEWGLSHGQGWKIDRRRPPAKAQRIFLRIEPERRQQVEAVATTAGGDISAWLRRAIQQVTAADFPASGQAASAEQGRAPRRSHDSRQYGTRFMLRLDEASLGKLDALTASFHTSRAEIIRQLLMQATPKVFPQSWHMAAAERRARLVRRRGRDLA
jgi:predicted transcriptional regulator